MTTAVSTQHSSQFNIFHSLLGKLTLIFLLVSVIPLVAVGLLAFFQSQSSLQTEAGNKLMAVRDLKADQMLMYFQAMQEDAALTAGLPTLAEAARGFEKATQQTGGLAGLRGLGYLGNPNLVQGGQENDYNKAHAQYHPLFTNMVETRGYYDMFLVDPSGEVVYSYAKEDDFATNLLDGPYKDSNLADLFRSLRNETNTTKVMLSDFAAYAPSGGAPASFVGTPVVQNGQNIGVLMYQLPMDRIRTIMQDNSGMGQTGETYLVGADKLMRSDSRFTQESDILKRKVETTGVEAAIAGETGVDTYTDYRNVPVIAAYQPLPLLGLNWVLLAEVDQEEAFAEATYMRNLMLAVIGGAVLIVVVIGFLVARSISKPIRTVANTATRLAVGDVNQTVEVHSRDEIGQMADAFRQMITYQQQMAATADRLAEGDVSANITPQSDQDVLGKAFTQMIAYLQQMAATANRLAQGDVSANISPQSNQDVLGNAFNQMITYQQQMAQAANRLAQGDVTVNVTPQSEKDRLGNAFSQMVAYQQGMAGVANHLAQGDVTVTVTPQSDKDVLGNTFRQMVIYQQGMAGVADRLALGDVTVSVTPQSQQDVLGHAFRQMVAYQQQMAEVADRMAQGDLTANITPQSDKDALGSAFVEMTANLRTLIGQVAESASAVNVASNQLATAAEQTGQASQQVTSTIQQVAQGTTQQTQAVTEATSNVEQMARAADGIARGAQEQAVGAQKTSTLVGEMANIVLQVGQVARSVTEANNKVTLAARNGVTAVAQTSRGMDTIHLRTTSASEKVKEMGARSKEIGRIIETIDDIADKTDMLALNAAVEAARAGEHGRGFAVVADQVRKLSEDSKTATRDIADLIDRVQETVREAIGAMESATVEVAAGTRLAVETARSLEDILQAAEQAAAMADNIGQAVGQLRQKSEGVVTAIESVSAIVEENTSVAEEMAASSQEVMQAMEGVASVAEENSASAEEVSASAEEMAAQIEEVVASAQEMASLAEQLREMVSQFRIDEVGYSESSGRGRATRLTGKQAAVLAGHLGNGRN